MWAAIISAILSLLEKIGADWLVKHKLEKADNAENKVLSLSDSELTKRVRDDITRH